VFPLSRFTLIGQRETGNITNSIRSQQPRNASEKLTACVNSTGVLFGVWNLIEPSAVGVDLEPARADSLAFANAVTGQILHDTDRSTKRCTPN